MDSPDLTEIEIAGMKIPAPKSNLYQTIASAQAGADLANTPTPDHNPFRSSIYRTDV